LALGTGIPVRALLDEDDEVIETMIAIYEERARRAKREG
jgi:hypothetical protein